MVVVVQIRRALESLQYVHVLQLLKPNTQVAEAMRVVVTVVQCSIHVLSFGMIGFPIHLSCECSIMYSRVL